MKIDLPGMVYSLALALGAWAIQYFTEGPGSGVPWAPILVATVPILLKTLTVQLPPPEVREEEGPSTRSFGLEPYEAPPPKRTKMQKFLLG